MRFKFSTEILPPEERFEAFRDNLARRLFQLDIISRSATPYLGIIDLTIAGQVSFGQVYGSAAEFVRTGKIAKQCEEGVWLLLNRRGRLRVSQGDTVSELAPGDAVVFDSVRIHEGHCLVESDTWVIKVPEDAIKLQRSKDAANKTMVLSGTAPITRLMHTALEAHHRLDEIDHPEAELLLGQYLADLVALAIGPSRDGAHLAEVRGLKAARLQAVLDHISRNFSHAGFSAADVAGRLGVSGRYVHLLLEETGASFSEHVLERRLTYAYDLLTNPGRLATRIGDIAFECGFSDLSHFNRSFRQRFGCTPSDARANGILNGRSSAV